MYNKLNHEAIDAYAGSFAAKIIDRHFRDNNVVSGEQIMSITEIRQVNLFIVKTLLAKWKQEAQKLKSPYFDYEAKPVKKALKEFLNLLSQHISIHQQEFGPLLTKATYDSLLLIFSPYDYYCKEVNGGGRTRVSLKYLKEASKYIKVNHHVIEALIARFERDGLKEVFNDEAFRLLNEIFEEMNMVPDDTEIYESTFSKIIPLNLKTIYGEEEKPSKTQAKPISPKIMEENFGGTSSGFSGSSINDQFSEKRKETLNEKLNASPRTNLADIHLNQKIQSIKKHITLNQKFMFINELFGGDEQSFEAAVDYLDTTCEDKESALSYLAQHTPSWNKDNEAKAELLKVLSKKYN